LSHQDIFADFNNHRVLYTVDLEERQDQRNRHRQTRKLSTEQKDRFIKWLQRGIQFRTVESSIVNILYCIVLYIDIYIALLTV